MDISKDEATPATFLKQRVYYDSSEDDSDESYEFLDFSPDSLQPDGSDSNNPALASTKSTDKPVDSKSAKATQTLTMETQSIGTETEWVSTCAETQTELDSSKQSSTAGELQNAANAPVNDKPLTRQLSSLELLEYYAKLLKKRCPATIEFFIRSGLLNRREKSIIDRELKTVEWQIRRKKDQQQLSMGTDTPKYTDAASTDIPRAPSNQANRTEMNRKGSWKGILEWEDKRAETTRFGVPVEVTGVSGIREQEVDCERWPTKLVMNFFPEKLMGVCDMENTKSIELIASPCQALDRMRKAMSNDYAGCVYLPSTSPGVSNLLFLYYAGNGSRFIGLIPHDQRAHEHRLMVGLLQQQTACVVRMTSTVGSLSVGPPSTGTLQNGIPMTPYEPKKIDPITQITIPINRLSMQTHEAAQQQQEVQKESQENSSANETRPSLLGWSFSMNPEDSDTFVKCEICDGYGKDLHHLRNHLLWAHNVKVQTTMIHTPPLYCHRCAYRFFTDKGLERHLLGTHGLVTTNMQECANSGEDAGLCPVNNCRKVHQKKLLDHVRIDHGMILKPAHLLYRCTMCTTTSATYEEFLKHTYSTHPNV
ncbi:uncharacterized protein LOC107980842 [Nasonia vitripennis]|uniref:C2H2-type domain-containing protein n=1 Tax=Nasonia vitripennis TaxID=7425 RepID=A0A7M7IQ39_NASVI|nr:uncharacterized protein LOC107980842 [Nasonia vitripennis]